MKIAILDDYQDVVRTLDCFKLLAGQQVIVLNQSYSEQELVSKLSGVDALVLIRERTVITQSLLAQLPQLRLISQTGKISHHIDAALCQRYAVAVAEGVGSPVAPAELCWALIMAAYRNIPAYAQNMAQDIWQSSGTLGLGRVLNGQTLGIWGYGKIGQRIARYGKAFEMNVLVWGSENSRANAIHDGFQAAPSKAEFFASADIVSLHLRLNEATEGCVTCTDLAAMKADSLLVNTSRAALIEQGALYHELCRCPTKRAALDVYRNEPATTHNEPLLSLPNVTALPHLGYVERQSYERYFKAAFDNILAFASGEPTNLVAPLK